MSDADFRVVQSVLRGERVRSELGRQLELFVFGHDTDVIISARGLELYRSDGGVRDRFGTAAAPSLLSMLLEEAGLARVEAPTYVELPDRKAKVWLLPNAEHVALVVRMSPATVARVVVRGGELPAFRELPRTQESFVTLPMPRGCPHCGREANRYEKLAESRSLVCGSCGHSFPASVLGR